ncbi:hypothetical protein SDC9_205467 [bioreactor metagenome]|uniref:Uncharacterized protein n=1 Tax=bioreactor metagenome TaxID=1076179 RepID=A0A645JDY9_9ZZZZ
MAQQQSALALHVRQLLILLLVQLPASGQGQGQAQGQVRKLVAELDGVGHGHMAQGQGGEVGHHSVPLLGDAGEQLAQDLAVRGHGDLLQLEGNGLELLLGFQDALGVHVLQGLGGGVGPQPEADA